MRFVLVHRFTSESAYARSTVERVAYNLELHGEYEEHPGVLADANTTTWACYLLHEHSVAELTEFRDIARRPDLLQDTPSKIALATSDRPVSFEDRCLLERAGFILIDDLPSDILQFGDDAIVIYLRGRIDQLGRVAVLPMRGTPARVENPYMPLSDEEATVMLGLINAENPDDISE